LWFAICLLVLSSLLFAPIWIFRKLLGKLHNAGPLSVRVMPLVSAVLLMAFDGLLAFGFRGLITARSVDDLFILGVPSLLTVSLIRRRFSLNSARINGGMPLHWATWAN